MSAPKVHNTHHLDAPQGAVYIGRGRGSTWGNPYEIGTHGDRDEVIAAHKADLLANPEELVRVRTELAGKSLVCFCKPAACHGDTLLWIANCPPQEFAELLDAALNAREFHS